MSDESEGGKKSDRVKGKFLLLQLLQQTDQGLSISEIAKNLGHLQSWKNPKQSLNYYLKKYVRLKYIAHVQTYPNAIYQLTELGDTVKNILTRGWPKTIWRCHSLILGYSVKSFGSFRFIYTSTRRVVPMKNWIYVMEFMEGGFVVHIQSTGLLKIYCPEKTGLNPDELFGAMYEEAGKIASYYIRLHDMKLGPMKIIKKGEKAIVNSQTLAKLIGEGPVTDDVWVDLSKGPEELEEAQDSYELENLLELPKKFENLEKRMDLRMDMQSTDMNYLKIKVQEIIAKLDKA